MSRKFGKKITGNLTLVSLNRKKDYEKVLHLVEKCLDFFIQFEGKNAANQITKEFFYQLPPGKTLDDKISIGVEDGAGDLIGLADILKEFPDTSTWCLGLLLFMPEYRRKGYGKAVIETLVPWIFSQDARKIRLGVIDGNAVAFAFWQSQGFIHTETKDQFQTGTLVTRAFVMEREKGEKRSR